jgi:hypothetical protein
MCLEERIKDRDHERDRKEEVVSRGGRCVFLNTFTHLIGYSSEATQRRSMQLLRILQAMSNSQHRDILLWLHRRKVSIWKNRPTHRCAQMVDQSRELMWDRTGTVILTEAPEMLC